MLIKCAKCTSYAWSWWKRIYYILIILIFLNPWQYTIYYPLLYSSFFTITAVFPIRALNFSLLRTDHFHIYWLKPIICHGSLEGPASATFKKYNYKFVVEKILSIILHMYSKMHPPPTTKITTCQSWLGN